MGTVHCFVFANVDIEGGEHNIQTMSKQCRKKRSSTLVTKYPNVSDTYKYLLINKNILNTSIFISAVAICEAILDTFLDIITLNSIENNMYELNNKREISSTIIPIHYIL